MPNCAVAVCENYNQKTKGSSISYHKFPKDPETCARWVQLCRKSDSINIKNATICSVHFKEDDYLRDLQAELMKLPPKKILKPTAVPSLHLIKAISAAAASFLSKKEMTEGKIVKHTEKNKRLIAGNNTLRTRNKLLAHVLSRKCKLCQSLQYQRSTKVTTKVHQVLKKASAVPSRSD
ncbi:THAP domain-containing protein 2-like [Schistocerca nitens]|uniref:THAP domain-containing protein 2-like n=1 Tax=Schistocerca nitens TaxID=7011 RepID=UPI0021195429|nr:THAP domain-containing protein 2-like [Schistocerca nitens]